MSVVSVFQQNPIHGCGLFNGVLKAVSRMSRAKVSRLLADRGESSNRKVHLIDAAKEYTRGEGLEKKIVFQKARHFTGSSYLDKRRSGVDKLLRVCYEKLHVTGFSLASRGSSRCSGPKLSGNNSPNLIVMIFPLPSSEPSG